MPTMILTRGIPGSGKSTFAKEWVAEAPGERVRVNRDGIRWTQGIRTGVGTPEQEATVTLIEQATITAALKDGRDVVVDAMNLAERGVRGLFKLAAKAGADVRFQDFPTDVFTCIQRNQAREHAGERFVETKVLLSIAKKFKVADDGTLPKAPRWTKKETPDLTPIAEYDPMLPDAYIFDTDGTVANHEGVRNPYDTSKYALDTVHENVAQLARTLGDQALIIGVSGRDAAFADVTQLWWLEKAFIRPDEFYFRPAGDRRPDDVIKAEIYEQEIRGRLNILGVVDDRARVLRMWRAKGFTTFAVGDTDNNDF